MAVFLSAPLKVASYEDRNLDATTWGLADVDLGARLRLLEQPVVLSVQGLVKIPGGYDEDEEVALGNGQLDLEGRSSSADRSIPSRPTWAWRSGTGSGPRSRRTSCAT